MKTLLLLNAGTVPGPVTANYEKELFKQGLHFLSHLVHWNSCVHCITSYYIQGNQGLINTEISFLGRKTVKLIRSPKQQK